MFLELVRLAKTHLTSWLVAQEPCRHHSTHAADSDMAVQVVLLQKGHRATRFGARESLRLGLVRFGVTLQVASASEPRLADTALIALLPRMVNAVSSQL